MMRRLALFIAATAIAVVGGYWLSQRPPAVTETVNAVSAAGVTLTSQKLTLPEEQVSFPPGAGGELLTINCTACHSPEMILNQPRLPADKWQATIDKMRKGYHASIAPEDDARLIAALTALPAQHAPATR